MKKKILFLTTGFEGSGGGKVASILENGLSKYFQTTTLLYFYDANVFSLVGEKKSLGSFGRKPLPGKYYLAFFPHLIRTIKNLYQHPSDYIISIGYYSNFLLLLSKKILGKKNNSKILLTQHEHYSSKWPYTTLFEKALLILKKKLIKSTMMVAVSEEVRKDIIKNYQLKDEQVSTIYNGLDIVTLKKLAEEKIEIKIPDSYIIAIGSLDRNKNHKLLIESYALLPDHITEDLHLLILGEGPLKQDLVQLTESLKIREKVHFLGFQKNPYNYLKKAKLLILTSFSEALPTVLLESLILKTSVISVPMPVAQEVLGNGNYGSIVKDYSPKELSNTIINLLKNPTKSKKHLENFKTKEQQFSLETQINNYLTLLNQL